jgi:hypothetical protein
MTCQELHERVTYSPKDPAPVAVALRGVWTPVDGGLAYLCRTCVGRLMARGVSIPVESHVWYDTAEPHGVCVGCEFSIPEERTV